MSLFAVSSVSHPLFDKAYSTSSTMTEVEWYCMAAAQFTVSVTDQLFGSASLTSIFAMGVAPKFP